MQSDNTYSSDYVDLVDFYYPSGILPANPDQREDDAYNSWAWGYGDRKLDRVAGLEQSLRYLFEILEKNGPFIGVVGFSMGGAMAAVLASFLEKRESLCGFKFETTHPPFKFAVCCSGFKLGNPFYKEFYSPKIETPILHSIAIMDGMIAPLESMQLAKSCSHASLYTFFGTHYVPRSSEFVETLGDFVMNALTMRDSDGDWEDYEDDYTSSSYRV
ncbi:hypothetical protein N7490_007853 [Penicillium lividum]|nr:hypothetical protein N7490_007853 [Penicillium lividum]